MVEYTLMKQKKTKKTKTAMAELGRIQNKFTS